MAVQAQALALPLLLSTAPGLQQGAGVAGCGWVRGRRGRVGCWWREGAHMCQLHRRLLPSRGCSLVPVRMLPTLHRLCSYVVFLADPDIADPPPFPPPPLPTHPTIQTKKTQKTHQPTPPRLIQPNPTEPNTPTKSPFTQQDPPPPPTNPHHPHPHPALHLREVVLLGVLAAALQALGPGLVLLPPRRPLLHRHHAVAVADLKADGGERGEALM